jgi:hypothetical protein
MDINVNGVNITLTKDQLDQIGKQLNKRKTVDDINSYEDACDILGDRNYSDKISVEEKLKTIIKAVNYLDNNSKEWKPDFTNNNEYKYIPYFQYKNGSGWLVYGVADLFSFAHAPVSLYFKSRSTAEKIANKFIVYYNNYIG